MNPSLSFVFSIRRHRALHCVRIYSRMSSTSIAYPKVRRDNPGTYTLHNQQFTDAYRWLENPASEETKEFVHAQNDITKKYLDAFSGKESFKESLTQSYNYERFGCPSRHGDAYYYSHNTGLQSQNLLYKLKSLDDKAQVFLNPNEWSSDGTVALTGTSSFSECGQYFAYGTSIQGSDWNTVFVMETESGQKMSDKVEWVKFSSIQWTHDSKGFFYQRYPSPKAVEEGDKGTETDANLYGKLYYHQIGTTQEVDVLIFESKEEPKWLFSPEVTHDGKYLMIMITRDCFPVNDILVLSLQNGVGNTKPVDLFRGFNAKYSYVTNTGNDFYFQTNKDAPREKLIKVSLDSELQITSNEDWLKEDPEGAVLESITPVRNDYFITQYTRNVNSEVTLRLIKSPQSHPIPIPTPIGNVCGISARRQDNEFFFKTMTFTSPGTVYHCKMPQSKPDLGISDLDITVWKESVVSGIQPAEWVAEQHWTESKDGTKIPFFMLRHKDATANGDNFTLLYGYGGFNHALLPAFSAKWLTMLKHANNGILLMANLRGGGEFGKSWYEDGTRNKKQNGFDDFAAIARWAITNNWTRKQKLVCNGGSNGGLLVAATMNQVGEELFAAGVAAVGVLDMMQFHKFTIGHAWISDYGNPDVKEDFETLIRYSPLHNVQDGSKYQYPATMLMTSDHDDRVVPLHSLKYIAELQYKCAKTNKAPLLLRHTLKAGHGAGKPISAVIDDAGAEFSFYMQATQS